MPLAARVLAALSEDALLRPGDRVLVALSGGSDSVALFVLLRELAAAGACEIAGAAHLNHGLRAEAVADEEFCRALAARAGVPFRSERADVRGHAHTIGASIEDAGRQLRYAFLERVADELGARAIATGHTRDDQAETFLLRLLRGAGPRGLAGIHPRVSLPAGAPQAQMGLPAGAPQAQMGLPAGAPQARRWVVRPLLAIGRDELREYLGSIGQPFLEDPSNRDVSIPRNRVRHELLPLLRERFSPAIVETLAREAAIARHDEERLHAEAIDLARLIVLTNGESVEVEVDALRSLPKALAVRVARLALQHLAPDRFLGFDHIDRLLDSVDGESLSLPGQHAEHRGGRIRLSRTPFRPFSNSFRVSLSIPGEVVLPEQGWAVSVASLRASGFGGAAADNSEAWVDPARVTLPLSVRSRRPGDRVRPLGMGGRAKKLQDVLVDRKVAREDRDALPLVVDGTDRIVWIVGEAVAEDFRVTEPSRGVIFLKARRLGGQG